MESIITDFTNGPIGNRSTDFYFKYNSKHAKYYYSRITGKRVAKSSIPNELIKDIQENVVTQVPNLVKSRKFLLEKSEKLQIEIEKVHLKIIKIDLMLEKEGLIEEKIKQYQKEEEKDEKRRKEYIKERHTTLLSTFNNVHCNNSIQNTKVKISILDEQEIFDKTDWKNWLKLNHPDRGGDQEIWIKIMAEGKNKIW